MTPAHTANGNGRAARPAPTADMVAHAALILGVRDPPPTAGAPNAAGPKVLVTVAGPHQRKVVRVPTDVPTGQLARTLADTVGVAVVGGLSVRGEVIHPAHTLGEAKVRAGSLITVDEAGAPRPAVPAGPAMAASPFPSIPPDTRRRPAGPGRGARQRFALGAVVAAAAALAGLGGAALAGPGPSSSSTPEGLAARAAAAWLAGRPFGGPRLPSVPADLGRAGGRPVAAVLEPAGWSSAAGITAAQFIVAPSGGAVYGLTVVTYHGRVAYPPTVTGLPFADTVGGGRAGTVPEHGTIVAPTAITRAEMWAAGAFGPHGTSPVAALGYHLAGPVTILDQWRPTGGPAVVARVQVPLSHTPTNPGAPGGGLRSVTVESVYDVAFTATGAPAAWVPADYMIGAN